MKKLFYPILSLLIVICAFPLQTIGQIQSNSDTHKYISRHEVVNIGNKKKNFGRKARNIILLIGDGMGPGQVTAGLVANGGQLNLGLFPYTGFSRTFSGNHLITDSAAGGTAMATGEKTNNGMVSVSPDSIQMKTILEMAMDNEKSTGLIVTSSITDATPASFFAHATNRQFHEWIATWFLKNNVDIFVGGGSKFFTDRYDSTDLTVSLENNGYKVVSDMEQLSKVQDKKIAGLFYPGNPPSIINGRGEMLEAGTKKALEVLSQNKKGFFLMVEGSQIDWGGHANDDVYITEEMLDFDKVVGLALKFAAEDKKTLVVVTADHETGGTAVIGGNIKRAMVAGGFSTQGHSANLVPVFAYGPGAEQFTGIMENTDIFRKMVSAFRFEK